MAEHSELNLWARQWRAEFINVARGDFRRHDAAFQSLKDKTTDYAKSIKMARDVCDQVLALWESSPVDLPAAVMEAAPAVPAARNVTAEEDRFLRQAVVRSSTLVAPGRLVEAVPAADLHWLADRAITAARRDGRYRTAENMEAAVEARILLLNALAALPAGVQGDGVRYYCNKCGYIGPQQDRHQRPNGTGECDYIAVRIREVAPPGIAGSQAGDAGGVAGRQRAIDNLLGDLPQELRDELKQHDAAAGGVACDEQQRLGRESAAFDAWWVSSGHAADPQFNLTIENCARAAWHARAAGGVLDEDQWKHAEALLLKAAPGVPEVHGRTNRPSHADESPTRQTPGEAQ